MNITTKKDRVIEAAKRIRGLMKRWDMPVQVARDLVLSEYTYFTRKELERLEKLIHIRNT